MNPGILKRSHRFVSDAVDLLEFVTLISIYVMGRVLDMLSRKFRGVRHVAPPLRRFLLKAAKKLDAERAGSISRINLIDLSLKNMSDKKTRTWITMGGMALGIGLIVLLVSIGYGLEQLVISRVARLEELKQTDVVPGLSDDLALTDKSVSDFKQVTGVAEVIPVISAVGKINYNNSETDMAVYGVTSKYLEESAIRPSSGKIYDSNDLSVILSTEEDKAASINAKESDGSHNVTYDLEDGSWYRVRAKPDPQSEIIGYTRRVTGAAEAVEIDGAEYSWEGEVEKKWLQASVPLWDKTECQDEEACEGGEYLPVIENGAQAKKEGYMAEIAMSIVYQVSTVAELSLSQEPRVLGETTDGSLPVVEIASLSAKAATENVTTKPLGGRDVRELVLNQAALRVLGLDESKAVGTKLTVVFVIIRSGSETAMAKTESTEAEYTIIGVIPDEDTPVVYVPFVDLRSLGVESYAQVKVIAKDKNSLQGVRTAIESTGYGTTSVVDTIGQIDKLFSSVRLFLATLGIVALAVAALGMFNTLTVSLLERTHEVGLMKAIGMKSSEVKELFMTESMIMGFFGGVMGLIIGMCAGLLLSIVLSLVAITKGAGFLNITHIPAPFAILIIVISLLVGIGTGYIPARRATRISALDALRYE